MAAISSRARNVRTVSSSAASDSSAFQSTSTASLTESSARWTGRSATRSLIFHGLGQAQQGPLKRHARSVGRRFVEGGRKVLVREAEFDMRDDELPLRRTQPLERSLVSIERLATDRSLERRRVVRLNVRFELVARRAAPDATQFHANRVQKHLTQVGLKRSFTPDLDLPDPSKCPDQCFLHKVLGFGQIAGIWRKAARGPADKARPVATDQHLERRLVAFLHPPHQVEGRLDARFHRARIVAISASVLVPQRRHTHAYFVTSIANVFS